MSCTRMGKRAVAVSLTTELVERIDEAAEADGRKRSNMIERTLREKFLPKGVLHLPATSVAPIRGKGKK